MTGLFDPEPSFDRDELRGRLDRLAERGVRIGGSSWKYEGWLDSVYSRQRYLTRGKFSKKLFEDTCLTEYATVFPTVCGDFVFYQFPSPELWSKVFRQTPPGFRFGFKVPEQITVDLWPVQPRYGALAGLANPTFLDAVLFEQAFLRVLEPWRERVGVLIFEFGAFRERGLEDFLRALDPFLAQLPRTFRYAVEIRNADFLRPVYFDCLRAHGVSHVFNAWTRMPEIGEQAAMSGARTSELIVARALLKRGRTYEEALRTFQPYTEVREVNEPVRKALRELVNVAIVDGNPAFIFVNNRLEGNSPGTIVSITD